MYQNPEDLEPYDFSLDQRRFRDSGVKDTEVSRLEASLLLRSTRKSGMSRSRDPEVSESGSYLSDAQVPRP